MKNPRHFAEEAKDYDYVGQLHKDVNGHALGVVCWAGTRHWGSVHSRSFLFVREGNVSTFIDAPVGSIVILDKGYSTVRVKKFPDA